MGTFGFVLIHLSSAWCYSCSVQDNVYAINERELFKDAVYGFLSSHCSKILRRKFDVNVTGVIILSITWIMSKSCSLL